jgi:ATP-dependent DNA ligase
MAVKPHRAVDWNEKAIAKVIAERGYVLAGVKVDGMRCHVLQVDGKVHFLTRSGIEIPSLANYAEYFEKRWRSQFNLADYHVLDCEVVLLGVDFQTGCGILRRDEVLAEYVPQFVVLDIVTQAHLRNEYTGELHAGFEARYAGIVGRFPVHVAMKSNALVVSESLAKLSSLSMIAEHYATVRGMGFEGLVVKDPACTIKNGKVSGAWKVKPGCGADFAPGWEGDGVVTGYVWGDEDKANAGKIVGFRVKLESGVEVNVTGLTQEQMEVFTDPTHPQGERGGYIGRYVEIKAMELTPAGSLRHPTFNRFRDLESAPGVKS